MSPRLSDLLPIHRARERRAQRHLHEQRVAVEQAQALCQATQAHVAQRLAEADLARQTMASPCAMSAAQRQWQLAQAQTLETQAQSLEDLLHTQSAQHAQAQRHLDQAQHQHAASVRSHRKMQDLCDAQAGQALRRQTAQQERLAEDAFLPHWLHAQGEAPHA